MTVNVRLYSVGSRDAENPELRPGMAGHLGDQQLLWIDADADASSLVRIDTALGLDRVVASVVQVTAPGLSFMPGAIRMSVMGLEAHDDPGRPIPILVHIIAAPNAVVSIHDVPVLGLEDPVASVAGDPRFGGLDAGTFVGLLLDGMLGGHFAEMDAIERDVDAVDERALQREPTDAVLDTLVGIRRRSGVIRRSLAAQREVFAALARPGEHGSPIGAPWPELTERLERAIDAAERARELLVGSFDIVMTRTGQRTNDIMRVLTVISIVLLPSVVIAGVMGMNFHPAFFDEPLLFFIVVAFMLVLALVTLVLARNRRWF